VIEIKELPQPSEIEFSQIYDKSNIKLITTDSSFIIPNHIINENKIVHQLKLSQEAKLYFAKK